MNGIKRRLREGEFLAVLKVSKCEFIKKGFFLK